jgi:predicted phage-related endonuclease
VSNLTHHPDRASWLRARRSGIGGSDAPAILGVARYGKSPMSVWASKVLPPEEDADSYTLARGRHMEGFIARRLREEAGLRSVDRESDFAIVTSAKDACLIYSPDAFATDADGTLVLCEFKSRIRDAREWEESVPDDVVAQAQHGMDVCDLPACYVACDTGSELRWTRLERDPKWATEVRPRLIAWWNEYVVTETPPPPTADDADVLARLYPRQAKGVTVALPGEMLAARDELNEAEAIKSACETKIAEIKNRVRAAMGEAETGVLPDGTGWTWKTQQRKAYTVEAGESRVLRAFKAKEK